MKRPNSCHGVDSDLLNQCNTWNYKTAYEAQATKLRDMLRDNFQ